MELLAKLGIDWRLLVAQVTNFALLLFVLTVFLYRPLLSLIDRRRERIAKALDDAKRMEEEVRRLDDTRQQSLKEIDRERGQLLKQAQEDAATVKEQLLTEARSEAERIKERARREMASEREETVRELHMLAAKLAVVGAQRILEREFNPDDQKRLLQAAVREIPSLLR